MERSMWETGFQNLGNNIYVYITSGETMLSNIALVAGDKYALLFDTLYSKKLTEEFISECRKYTDKPIRYLVISHAHGDHFLGAGAVPDATVICHDTYCQDIEAAKEKNSDAYLTKAYPALDFTGKCVPYPDISIRNTCSIDLGGRVVEIMHPGPAHTQGDLLAYVPDCGVLLAGDVVQSKITPATHMADIPKYIQSLEKLESLPVSVVVPGHGPVTNFDEVALLKKYFSAVLDTARAIVDGHLPDDFLTPSAIELEMLRLGWRETSRTAISISQYCTIYRGEQYKFDINEVKKFMAARKAAGMPV